MQDAHDTGDSGAAAPPVLGARFDGIVVEDAPAQVLEQIVHRFRVRAQTTPSPGLGARVAARVRAVLAFDDLTSGPALALRGGPAPAAGPRHLVFTAEPAAGTVEVAVSIYPLAGDRVSIVGQLMTDQDEPHVVDVVAGSDVVGHATCSTHGEFAVEAPAAWDELVLVGPETDIVLAIGGEDDPTA